MAISVKVGTVPGTLKDVLLEEGATVQDAIEVAGYDATTHRIQVNGDSASLSDEVNDDDVVALLKKIESGI